MKSDEKENIRLIALSPSISSLEDSIYYEKKNHAMAIQAGQKFRSNLQIEHVTKYVI